MSHAIVRHVGGELLTRSSSDDEIPEGDGTNGQTDRQILRFAVAMGRRSLFYQKFSPFPCKNGDLQSIVANGTSAVKPSEKKL